MPCLMEYGYVFTDMKTMKSLGFVFQGKGNIEQNCCSLKESYRIWCSEKRQEGRPSLHPRFKLCTMHTRPVTFDLCSHKAGMTSTYFPTFSWFGSQPDTTQLIPNYVKLSKWSTWSNQIVEMRGSAVVEFQCHWSALRESQSLCSARFGQVCLVQALHGAAQLRALSL